MEPATRAHASATRDTAPMVHVVSNTAIAGVLEDGANAAAGEDDVDQEPPFVAPTCARLATVFEDRRLPL